MHRLDRDQLIEALVLAPGEESPAGMEVGSAGVRVLDRDGAEFQVAARRLVAGRHDDRPHDRSAVAGGEGLIFEDHKGGRLGSDSTAVRVT